MRVASRTGSALAANCTASGKALLAELPDAEVAAIFGGDAVLPALTARSVTTCSRLLAELRQVRERGCAVNIEESEEGVASVAVAVRGPGWQPATALAVSVPMSRMTGQATDTIMSELRERAAWLEGQLRGATYNAGAAVGVHHGAGDPAGAVRGQGHVARPRDPRAESDLQRRATAQVLLPAGRRAQDLIGEARGSAGPVSSVSNVPPGATPLTLTCGASSCASAITQPRTANFDAT